MKFNKWTVALAAVGVVSLASAAKAEEKPSSVMTALSSTTISGTVDTSMEWNPGTGNQNLPPYKFNSPSMADGFNLDVVQLTIEKPLDESDWAAGYRADLWFGPYANQLGTQSVSGIRERVTLPSGRPMSPCALPWATAWTSRSAYSTASLAMSRLMLRRTRTSRGLTATPLSRKPRPAC